jgi:hypothetical protein
MEHWIAVGVVSDLARAELYRANCPVVEVQQPRCVLLCLRYDETFHEQEDLELWTSGDVRVKSRGLDFLWHGQYGSLTESRLTLPCEDATKSETAQTAESSIEEFP